MKKTTAHRQARRRGTALVCIIILLLLLEIATLGIVTTQPGESYLGVDRLNTVGAFYNAESGLNMSMRELYLGVDEDGDGRIGTISDDDDPDDDPVLNGGTFAVSAAAQDADTVVTSTGRRQTATRYLRAIIGPEQP